ncbi:methyltransferase domain-containing protein [bacterium]|nr:methyltransferase domain-containing protein [bacterium]
MDTLSAIQAINHDSYGRIASLWDRTVKENYDFELHERCRNLFIRHLPGKRILEVGCGLGWDSHFFSLAGYDVTATDFQEEFIALTKSRNPGVKAQVMDMTIPAHFPEPFHGIYGFASFLHIPREQSEETLKRLAALLCDNGVFFLHHVRSNKGIIRYTQPRLLIDNNPAYCFCHSEDEMKQMLLNAGLSSIQFTGYSSGKSGGLSEELGLSPYQVLSFKK